MLKRTMKSASNQIYYQRETHIRNQSEADGGEEQRPLEDSLATRIILMHIVQLAIRSRLYLLSRVILHCPEVVTQIQDFLAGQPDHPLCTMDEMVSNYPASYLTVFRFKCCKKGNSNSINHDNLACYLIPMETIGILFYLYQ